MQCEGKYLGWQARYVRRYALSRQEFRDFIREIVAIVREQIVPEPK